MTQAEAINQEWKTHYMSEREKRLAAEERVKALEAALTLVTTPATLEHLVK